MYTKVIITSVAQYSRVTAHCFSKNISKFQVWCLYVGGNQSDSNQSPSGNVCVL